ncbi:YdcF family protein [Azospirillum sp. SYSU D00513]|uniref:YdcF family protein n=1 Tax=Azospirillum sp. SYSU D00513 TaxID=2812561 RepID=UPI001FFFD278|nr:YdcF family protein [Azospirillum sp. SYSU D00513]
MAGRFGMGWFGGQGRVARALSRLLATALALALLWAGGFVWFAETIPQDEPAPAGEAAGAQRRTDAIVVLTGGSGRLRTGLRLLAEGQGRKLFVSGVYDGVEVQELLRLSRQSPDEVECCITLGYSADNTIGNAHETAGWMKEQGFTSMRLVTANYHMRRSLLEFRMAAPEIEVVPHPVASPNVHLADWWRWPGTANLLMNEYNKYIVAVFRSWIERLLDGA